MAHHMINYELLESSDEENLNVPLPPIPPILDDNDDDFDELQLLHPVFGIVQRIEHVKVNNYIENIVYNYNNVDFIMHFRLSRVIAYKLIDRFRVSEIFISIQDCVRNIKITA